MGGIISLRYVLAYPERVRSLVLMDTGAAPAGKLGDVFGPLAQLGREQGMDAVFATVKRFWVQQAEASGLATPDVMMDRVESKFTRMDPEAFGALADALGEYPSMVERLGEIGCPTTVLVGENDTGLRASADVLAQRIPGAELVVIPDAGHSPQEDQPQLWIDAVQRHLSRRVDGPDRSRPHGPPNGGRVAPRRVGAVRRRRRSRIRRAVGGVRALHLRARDVARGRHTTRARRAGRRRRVHRGRSRTAPVARDGRRRRAGPAVARDRTGAVRRRTGRGRRRRDACPGVRCGRARRHRGGTRSPWSPTRSPRWIPARRFCSPRSVPTRRRDGNRRRTAPAGPTPK